MMTERDRNAALAALSDWFMSQEIEPGDAAYMCARMCGLLATKDVQIKVLVAVMRRAKQEYERDNPNG